MSDPAARELKEALERETATAEILQIIASSPADTQPVFDAIVQSGLKLFPGSLVSIALRDGNTIDAAAVAAPDPARVEAWRRTISRTPPAPARNYMHGAALADGRIVDIPDAADAPAEFAAGAQNFLTSGNRAITIIPMMRHDAAIGVLSLVRQAPGPLSDEQLALLKTFAAQAVIAIENTRLVNELRHRTDDLSESLEQQTATAEILQVISNSPTDTQPVFDAIVQSGLKLFPDAATAIQLRDGDKVRAAAVADQDPKREQAWRGRFPDALSRDRMHGAAILDGRLIDVPDAEVHVGGPFAPGVRNFLASGYRAITIMPMIRGGTAIGAISVIRLTPGPLSAKQIELLRTFTDQAVIAIENARLFNELRQRTNDLSESLEQQTATSEVLKVISGSPGAVEPVFNTMLESAVRICAAQFGFMYLYREGAFHLAVMHNAPPAYEQARRAAPLRPDPDIALGRLVATRATVHVADLQAEPEYIERNPITVGAVELGGIRTLVMVPMLKDDELFGLIAIYRQHVAPFSPKQITLLENFAAQAVIAIENTRLLNELRQRTEDLSESLEQQTATSEVLKVISSSPGELEPVFEAMLVNATRICEAKFGMLFRSEGDTFHFVAEVGTPPELAEFQRQRGPFQPQPGGLLHRTMTTKRVIHNEDDTQEAVPMPSSKLGGARSIVGVPMLKDDELIGAIVIFRQEVRPFTAKQIELVQNFAAQAVIAIENTRLLNEVRQQANQLEAQSAELRALNQQLEGRVAEQVGEIERMGRLRRFLSPQVADLIVSSGSEKQLESHRREISALFCDLRGFTGFSESSDPEDVMALLREYHKAIGEIIFRHGGTLERFAGDGVMVIFGDPVSLDNPALAAVTMALEMRVAISALIEKWRRLGHELGFGIGIAHGYATLGTIGFEGRFDYAAIGTVSNVASRLCDEAQPGQILVSPRVLLAVEEAVSVEPVAEMSLKGIRRPIQVHNVVGARAKDS